jgi:hypothetical protein
MYRKVEQAPSPAEEFELSSGCKLAGDNRWVQLAQLIPWSEFEQEYAQIFGTEMGPPAKSFRLTLGALIIKAQI